MKDRTTRGSFTGNSDRDSLTILHIANSELFKKQREEYVESLGEGQPLYLLTYSQLMRSELVSGSLATTHQELNFENFIIGDGYTILEEDHEDVVRAPLLWSVYVLDGGKKFLALTLEGIVRTMRYVGGSRTMHQLNRLATMMTDREREKYVMEVVFGYNSKNTK